MHKLLIQIQDTILTFTIVIECPILIHLNKTICATILLCAHTVHVEQECKLSFIRIRNLKGGRGYNTFHQN